MANSTKVLGMWADRSLERLTKTMARQDDVSVSKLLSRLVKAEAQRRKELHGQTASNPAS